MKQITRYIISGVIVTILLFTGMGCKKQYQLQQQLAEKVLRFHVLANSDSVEDQNLKLAVRDAVGGFMQEKTQNLNSKSACEKLVMEQIPEIETVAEQVIAESGYDYEVHAELTKCKFPTKTYGNYTFPKGTYDALKLTIGEGRGQNWWCVMYPNMCFENSMYEVVNEEAKENLRAVLDEDEYQAVLNSGSYEVRFWLFEIFR